MSPRINSSWKGARKCLCKYRTFKCGMEYPSFVLNKAEQDQHQETKACQTKYIPFLSITMLQRTLLFTLSHHGNIVVLKLCSCRITALIVELIFKWILIITEINGYHQFNNNCLILGPKLWEIQNLYQQTEIQLSITWLSHYHTLSHKTTEINFIINENN